jgi:hypothetical protein
MSIEQTDNTEQPMSSLTEQTELTSQQRGMQTRLETPGYREKLATGIAQSWEQSDTRAAREEGIAEAWQHPEKGERLRAGLAKSFDERTRKQKESWTLEKRLEQSRKTKAAIRLRKLQQPV